MSKVNLNELLVVLLLLLMANTSAFAQGTVFTYQGKLTDSGSSANGQYDFQFKLFDTATVGTGTQQGSLVSVTNVTVTSGIFTVQLDFGACASCFNGAPRFLEIAVKPTSVPTFTTLTQRQPMTSTPYAIKSQTATSADGLSGTCVNCVTSGQIASIPAGSASYIQNTTSPQASSNFTISGNGSAAGTLSGNVVHASTQYNLGGNRIMSNSVPLSNMFVGVGAGTSNTSGSFNSFFGDGAGQFNNVGGSNSFFGTNAGQSTDSGGPTHSSELTPARVIRVSKTRSLGASPAFPIIQASVILSSVPRLAIPTHLATTTLLLAKPRESQTRPETTIQLSGKMPTLVPAISPMPPLLAFALW
ncbi:MAG TPA: hypothetical protein VE604_05475 [Candidatus Polarisedimenticolia bacterium]|nr:hypothetical protein [Candidatus Polarisedimenticolia bacterium]